MRQLVSHCICSQETDGDECWLSDHFFLFIQSGSQAHEMVLCTSRVSLPTSTQCGNSTYVLRVYLIDDSRSRQVDNISIHRLTSYQSGTQTYHLKIILILF